MIRRYRNGDVNIRALEMIVRADPDDIDSHRRFLTAKLRVGLLSHDQLVMAARLGHPAARLAAPEWHEFVNNAIYISPMWYTSVDDPIYIRRFAMLSLSNYRDMVSFACDCVERVIYIFEQVRPGDMRPMLAIKAIREWIATRSNETIINDAMIAATDAVMAHGVSDADYRYIAYSAASGEAAAKAVAAVVHSINCSNDASLQTQNRLIEALDMSIRSIDLAVDLEVEVDSHNEQLWQCTRLAQYFINETTFPMPYNAGS